MKTGSTFLLAGWVIARAIPCAWGAPSADLVLTKTDSPDPVLTGSNVTYTLVVSNAGPDVATGVSTLDTLPSGLSFAAAASSQGSCTVTADPLGMGAFGGVLDFNLAGLGHYVVSSDVDGDGQPDLAVANWFDRVSVYRNIGNGPLALGRFAAEVPVTAGPNNQPWSCAMGDLDGDGKPDLVAGDFGDFRLVVWRNLSSPGSVSFGGASAYFVESPIRCFYVLLRDMDGDGRLDVIVSRHNASAANGVAIVSFLRNTSTPGTISFAAGQTHNFPNGGASAGVAIADFDGDNKLDVAVAQYASNAVRVLRGASFPGTITFSAEVNYQLSAGSGPIHLVAEDFDGDGKPDLAVANSTSDTVSLLPNTGAPGTITFAARVDFATPARPWHLQTGDLNCDGKPDLVAVNRTGGNISVWRNVTTGPGINAATFAARVDTTIGTQPTAVAINDLDADGRPDLALSVYGDGSFQLQKVSALRNIAASPSVSCDLGDLAGGATASVTLVARTRLAGGITNTASVTSLTSDPNLVNNTNSAVTVSAPPNGAELVLLKSAAPDPVAVGGVLTYTLTVTNVGPANATSVMLSDSLPSGVNFVSASPTVGSCALLPANLGGGSFADSVEFPAGDGPRVLVVGDLDGDGKPDLVTTDELAGTVSIRRNVSAAGTAISGWFAPRFTLTAGGGPYGAALADLDSDGKLDLVVCNPTANQITVFRNHSSPGSLAAGSFDAAILYATGTSPLGVVVADLNADTKPDIAVACGGGGVVAVHRNFSTPGNIVIGSAAQLPVGGVLPAIAAGDFNFDGYPDLAVPVAVANGDTTVAILRNVTFEAAAPAFASAVFVPVGLRPWHVVVADLDGDGKVDLACANRDSGSASMLRNTTAGTGGAITFAGQQSWIVGTSPTWLAIRDLNSDGKPDVVAANSGGNNVNVLQNFSTPGNINFGLQPVQNFVAVGTDPYSVAIADFDLDGRPDLATANNGADDISILRNVSAQNLSCSLGTLAPGAGAIVALTVATTSAGTVTNTASVTNTAPDPNLANNTATAVTTVAQSPVITAQPANQTVCVGATASFSVSASGTPPLSYQWQLDGVDLVNGGGIVGATTATLILVNVTPANAGPYTVVVTNSAGAATSASATLTVVPADFGDAPPPYRTLLSTNGARHCLVAGFHLGPLVDAEADGQPGAGATGDDAAGADDEDGITFGSYLVPGFSAQVKVAASAAGKLDAWIDFNGDGNWTSGGDQIFANQPLNAGVNLLTFFVPATASPGINTFARFRFSSAGGLSFTGQAPDGEVEDYSVSIIANVVDLGDAPDNFMTPNYPTLVANGGAAHTISPDFHLGEQVDPEPNGQPDSNASGDDTNGGPDDEDGVTLPPVLAPGQNASVTAAWTDTAMAGGYLYGWIDFNADGDWNDPGEAIIVGADLSTLSSPATFTFTVPANATITAATYARFRLDLLGGVGPAGPGNDGEVEDYKVAIQAGATADLSVTKAANPASVPVGGTLTYTIVVNNAGPVAATGVTLVDALPAGVAFVSATPTQGTCANAAGTVTCNLGALDNGASATVVIVVTATTEGALNNTVTVSADQSDPVPGNNTGSAQTPVTPATPSPCTANIVAGLMFNPDGSGECVIWTPAKVFRYDTTAGFEASEVKTEDGDPILGVQGVMFDTEFAVNGSSVCMLWTVDKVFHYDLGSGTIAYEVKEGGESIGHVRGIVFNPEPFFNSVAECLIWSDTKLRRYNAVSGLLADEVIQFGGAPIDDVRGVAFNPDGQGQCLVWQSGALLHYDTSAGLVAYPVTGGGEQIQGVRGCVVDPELQYNGQSLALVWTDARVYRYSFGSGDTADEITDGGPHLGGVRGMAMDPEFASNGQFDVVLWTEEKVYRCAAGSGFTAEEVTALDVGTIMDAQGVAFNPETIDNPQAKNLIWNDEKLFHYDAGFAGQANEVKDGVYSIGGVKGAAFDPAGNGVCLVWTAGELYRFDFGSLTLEKISFNNFPIPGVRGVVFDPEFNSDALRRCVVWTPDEVFRYDAFGSLAVEKVNVGGASIQDAQGVVFRPEYAAGNVAHCVIMTPLRVYRYDMNAGLNAEEVLQEGGGAISSYDPAQVSLVEVVVHHSGFALPGPDCAPPFTNCPPRTNGLPVGLTPEIGGGSGSFLAGPSAAGLVGSPVFTPVAFAGSTPAAAWTPQSSSPAPHSTVLGAALSANTTMILGPQPAAGVVAGNAMRLLACGESNLLADVSIAKTNSTNVVLIGSSFTYTLTVANAGPSPATGVNVTDILPASLTFVSAVSSAGLCVNVGGTINCTLSSLPANASATVTITVTPSAPGVVTNTATVTADALDPDLANNASTSTVTIVPPLAPRLFIELIGNAVRLTWEGTGYVLQCSPTLSPARWVDLTNDSPATLPITPPQSYYRLNANGAR